MRFRPFNGRSSTPCDVTSVPIVEVSVCNAGATLPATSTVCEISPTSILASMRARSPAATVRPDELYNLKPLSSTFRAYVPTWTDEKTKSPEPDVCAVCETFVSTFVSVTTASGRTAPLESVTVPTTAALFCCAFKFPLNDSKRHTHAPATPSLANDRLIIVVASPFTAKLHPEV